jgi:transposase-like protein
MIGGMTTAPSSPSYKGYRFPAEIISHAMWPYFRFSLSYRDVEELMAVYCFPCSAPLDLLTS